MLIYHPSRDPNHGTFRLLKLLEAAPNRTLAFDMYRILDFYYLFPHLLVPVRLPPRMMGRKKRLAQFGSRFSQVPSPRIFLQQLRPLQEIVAKSLAAKGLLEPDLLGGGTLSRTHEALPADIHAVVSSQEASEKELVELLAGEVSQVPLLGRDGLKARTGLLEYRYDPV